MPEPPASLLQLPALRGATVRRRLTAGPLADSWLIEQAGSNLVLRVDRPLASALGLDRAAEWRFLAAAWEADLGPQPVHRAPGVLVTRYLDGPEPAGHEAPTAEDCRALGRILRRVHETPAPGGKRLDLPDIARRYALAAGGREAWRLAVRLTEHSGALYADSPLCLCHHDAHLGNLVGRDTLRLIDWEYAALGQPLLDLAVVIRFHGLGPGRSAALIEGWSGEAPLADPGALGEYCDLYDDLARLWALAVAPG